MRIRKNAKISQLSSISSTPSSSSTSISNPLLLKTHQYLQCQLNQSPWDVITFPIPPQDDSFSPHFQEVEYFGIAGNGSFADDSIEATHSPYSTSGQKRAVTMGCDDRKWHSCEVDREDSDTSTQVGFSVDEGAKGNDHVDDGTLCCQTNRKGWQCGREVKKGHKVCARHLRYVTAVGGKNTAGTDDTMSTPAPRRGRGRPPKKKKVEPADQNPYDFYNYSGFGPQWGKKTGLIKRTVDNLTTGIHHEIVTNGAKHEEAKRIQEKEIDYMECDDSEEEDGEEIGKKRGRKRIKARSLKSLM